MGAIGLHAKLSANVISIDREVKLVDLFKTMELLNNRYAFYMLGRGFAPPQTPPRDDWSFMGAIGLHAKLSANIWSL